MTDYELMGAALEEAARAAALGEVPVGAVVARNGEIIAAAHNTRETEKNALHHAELLAIDAACKKLGGWRLWQCELFVTLEPCPMCSGGIINSRIRRVVYGAADTKAGCCGSVTDLFALPFNHHPVVESGLHDLLKSDNAYYIYSASEWLEEMNEMINMVIIILTGIASISLLVGGIGIMNIMLVSVTERTREIGIRKALGAKERVILSQFVVEAATTSALGGVLGIVLGYIVSMAANRILPMISSSIDVTVSPSFNSIVVAFGISVGIGVLFGYLPAKRAARLNPIEALRYD